MWRRFERQLRRISPDVFGSSSAAAVHVLCASLSYTICSIELAAHFGGISFLFLFYVCFFLLIYWRSVIEKSNFNLDYFFGYCECLNNTFKEFLWTDHVKLITQRQQSVLKALLSFLKKLPGAIQFGTRFKICNLCTAP